MEGCDMDFSDIIATVKYEKDVVASSGTKIVIQGIKNLNFWDMDKNKEEISFYNGRRYGFF